MEIRNTTLFDAAALPLNGPKGELLLIIIAKGTFGFNGQTVHIAEDQAPIAYGDQYHEDSACVRYESDMAPPKSTTDIVFNATAYAPGGKPAEVVPVEVDIGPARMRMLVFGERFWNHDGILSRNYRMTSAKPFERKALVYEEAFGGMDEVTGAFCAENLVGKGFYGPRQNLAGKPLPCIEDPRHLIRTIHDHPRPKGLGFIHRAWQPRAGYAGTYDQQWQKTRCPLPPTDFDARFYNGAHPDLQCKDFLEGNEAVKLTNLTVEGQTQFQLPGLTLLSHLAYDTNNGQENETTLLMNLDTLFFETDEHRFSMVWRSAVEISDPPAGQIKRVSIEARQG
ncbi:MAG: DUF2169 domain-containing protein [Desulfatitalea sp.]|nr:DUF2169 domain-containing protein [Desulfatitalea sp.]